MDHSVGADHREYYTYDTGGRMTTASSVEGSFNTTTETYTAPSGTGVVVSEFDYDHLGRQTSQIDYLRDGVTVAYIKETEYNIKGQVLSDSITIERATQTDRMDSTYTYGSYSDYAFGQALTATVAIYKDGLFQHNASTTNTYNWYDGPVQQTVAYKPNAALAPTNTSTYLYGSVGGQAHLYSVGINDGRPRTVTFTNDLTGQTMRRDEADGTSGTGDPHEIYYAFGGKQMGYVGNNNTRDAGYSESITQRSFQMSNGPFRTANSVSVGDFDQSLSGFNSYNQGSEAGWYTVRGGETLASIAANLWGDASLWYKLAEVNGLGANSALMDGQQLMLPAGVVRSTYNASTFTPYDPASVLGDTAPTAPVQPKPKKNNCGLLGQIFVAVLSVAITQFLGPVLGNSFYAWATAGAIGNATSQYAAVQMGIQEKFSWTQVATSALSAGVDQGSTLNNLAKGDGWGAGWSAFKSGAISQAASVAVGPPSKFDWVGLATSSISAGVAGWAGGTFNSLISGGAGALAGSAARSLYYGTDFELELRNALPSVIGSTIGADIASAARGYVNSHLYNQGAMEAFERGYDRGPIEHGSRTIFAGPGAQSGANWWDGIGNFLVTLGDAVGLDGKFGVGNATAGDLALSNLIYAVSGTSRDTVVINAPSIGRSSGGWLFEGGGAPGYLDWSTIQYNRFERPTRRTTDQQFRPAEPYLWGWSEFQQRGRAGLYDLNRAAEQRAKNGVLSLEGIQADMGTLSGTLKIAGALGSGLSDATFGKVLGPMLHKTDQQVTDGLSIAALPFAVSNALQASSVVGKFTSPGAVLTASTDTKLMLQSVVDRAVADLAASPGMARELMSLGSYNHLVKNSELASASYGKAVERLTARYVMQDRELSQHLSYLSRPFVSTPDFVGIEAFKSRPLDITTSAAIPKHLARRYGPYTDYVTHPGLPANLIFPELN